MFRRNMEKKSYILFCDICQIVFQKLYRNCKCIFLLIVSENWKSHISFHYNNNLSKKSAIKKKNIK